LRDFETVLSLTACICIGVHGEDTGILACQQVTNNDIIAYVDVVVYGKQLCRLSLLLLTIRQAQ